MGIYNLAAKYAPAGDQPVAIEALAGGIAQNQKYQTLLGVTGSGKTFTIANVIARFDRPVLLISHNKTLAAQLYSELREFFPDNAVEYFVSYYDYYQPEAYIPQTDVYIEKDAQVNEDLDRLRLAATSGLMTRRDVIIVASVSCIYGLGSPADYEEMMVYLRTGTEVNRREMLQKLAAIQYDRNDVDFKRGTYRVRGDVIEIWPAYEHHGLRVSLWGDEVERLEHIQPVTGETIKTVEDLTVFPAKHFVVPEGTIDHACEAIEKELDERLRVLRRRDSLLEAQRLESRTRYDLEMLREIGYCKGVENYSRHLAGREPGSRPYCLLDYFPEDYILIVDESHATIPQVHGMFKGDHARKLTLVEHGFRLPSALDNRPLRFEEFENMTGTTIFMSATPAKYELEKTAAPPVQQVVRPTGLVDPPIEIRPAEGAVRDLMAEIEKRAAAGERVLVTTLTKRSAEDLAEFMAEGGINGCYLHSELDAFERVEILQNLREGNYDVVVGVNLLREGLDLPEVTLVGILDADKQGFLRSQTSLTQTIGRAARNCRGTVILYADTVTDAIRNTIDETDRRRVLQEAYNAEHGITPETVQSAIKMGIREIEEARKAEIEALGVPEDQLTTAEYIGELEIRMLSAAEEMRFEEAAEVRDKIRGLQGRTVDKKPERRAGKKKRRKKIHKGGRIPRPRKR